MPSHRPGARTPQWPVGHYLRREGLPDLAPPAVLTPTAVGAGLVLCASAGLLTVVLTGQQQAAGPSTGGDGLATGPADPASYPRPPSVGPTRAPGTAAAPQAPSTVLALPVSSPESPAGVLPGGLTGGGPAVAPPPAPWQRPTVRAGPPLLPLPPVGSPTAPVDARPEGSDSPDRSAEARERTLAAPPTADDGRTDREQSDSAQRNRDRSGRDESEREDSDGVRAERASSGGRTRSSGIVEHGEDREGSADKAAARGESAGNRSGSTGKHQSEERAENSESGKHGSGKHRADEHDIDKHREGKHHEAKHDEAKHDEAKHHDRKDRDRERQHRKHHDGEHHDRDGDGDREDGAGKDHDDKDRDHEDERQASSAKHAESGSGDRGKQTAERVLTLSWAATSRSPVLA